MHTFDERYQNIAKALRNYIISEKFDIFKENQDGMHYRYYTSISTSGMLIPIEITLSSYNEAISVCFYHDSVPEERIDITIQLINNINNLIRIQHFVVCPQKEEDVVVLYSGVFISNFTFNENAFRTIFYDAIKCAQAFFPLISEAIKSAGDLEEVISDFMNKMKIVQQ